MRIKSFAKINLGLEVIGKRNRIPGNPA